MISYTIDRFREERPGGADSLLIPTAAGDVDLTCLNEHELSAQEGTLFNRDYSVIYLPPGKTGAKDKVPRR